MSIEKIIQESVNKNPLAMKEALEEELRSRVALALEAKMSESDDEDEDDEDDEDEDDEDMDESFDLSEDTMHADIDHMGGHDAMAKKHNISLATHKHGTYAVGKKKDLQKYLVHHYDGDHGEAKGNHPEVFKESFDQLDELDKKTLASYVKKAGGAGKEGLAHAVKSQMSAADSGDRAGYKKSQRQANNRSTGIQRAADRLAK
jgi:hypothetical protein